MEIDNACIHLFYPPQKCSRYWQQNSRVNEQKNEPVTWKLRIVVIRLNDYCIKKDLELQGEFEKSITFWVIFFNEKLVLYFRKVSNGKLV